MWLALFLILQPGQQGNAIQLKVFWNADIGCIKSCRVEIHCGNQLVIITGLKFSFPPHKHWGVSTARIGLTLIAFLRPVQRQRTIDNRTIIGGKENNCIVILSVFLQLFENAFYTLINRINGSVVVICRLTTGIKLLLILLRCRIIIWQVRSIISQVKHKGWSSVLARSTTPIASSVN